MDGSPIHVPQQDIYSDRRAGIIERLESGLHPHAPWRDPREISAGRMTRMDETPFVHTLAGACVWLRKNPTGRHDVSADLLWCIVMQDRCDAERERVVTALMAKWVTMHSSIAVIARTPVGLPRVERAATQLVLMCTTGIVPRQRKPPLQWRQWCVVRESGERMLWVWADRASRRAVRALR